MLVAELSGDATAGHWGELMCIAAAATGIAGVVVAGSVRDLAQIEARRFPVFHDGADPRPASKAHPGELGTRLVIEDVQIDPGDLIVADADGIAVVPEARINHVLAKVVDLEHREAELERAVASGTSTLDALGLSLAVSVDT